MSRLNSSLINDYQSKTLAEKIESVTNGIDFNYLGYDKSKSEKSFVKYGNDANINRVLFWLSSKRKDYVREEFKGGILYDLLGQLCSTTNLTDWENTIRSKFNEEFSEDLNIVLLKLTTDKTYRKLVINMVVQDKLKNITFPVSTEARL